jgi:hypothetical protein
MRHVGEDKYAESTSSQLLGSTYLFYDIIPEPVACSQSRMNLFYGTSSAPIPYRLARDGWIIFWAHCAHTAKSVSKNYCLWRYNAALRMK